MLSACRGRSRRGSSTTSGRSSTGPGASDYERYLRTDELLSLQKTPAERAHHDELLFQCTHQASELWLKLAGEEMELATEHLGRGEIAPGAAPARPRDPLLQARHAEPRHARADVAVGVHGRGAAGARPRQRLRLARLEPRAPRGARARSRPSTSCAAREGLSLLEVYVQGREREDLYQLAEALTDLDEWATTWRVRHFMVVERIIGGEVVGTQGTPVELLGKLVDRKLYPELWKVRTELTNLRIGDAGWSDSRRQASAPRSPEGERAARGGSPRRARSSSRSNGASRRGVCRTARHTGS